MANHTPGPLLEALDRLLYALGRSGHPVESLIRSDLRAFDRAAAAIAKAEGRS